MCMKIEPKLCMYTVDSLIWTNKRNEYVSRTRKRKRGNQRDIGKQA